MKVLALDLGTSSVRGMVLDDATVSLPAALARRKITIEVGEDGAATIDAPRYLDALLACVDELAAAGHLDGVELVAACAQWHSVLPLDTARAPLGPVLTWLDTRAVAPPGTRGPRDEVAFHWRTGTWWHRFFWTVRLPWLRARCGGVPIRFVGLAEFVFGALLDEAPMSVSQASGTGMLNLTTLTWDAEACEVAGVRPGELPPLAPADWRGRLRPEYARRWPALAGATWTAPLGDGAAATLGSACLDDRRAAVTVGTSAAVRLVQTVPAGVPPPHLPAGLWRYRVDHERIVTGTAYSAGGNLFAWAERELRLPDGPALDEALVKVPPGSGARVDPRFGGDRPPGLAPAGSGQVCGIGFSTTAVEILAGLMDAVCARIADDLERIESTVDHMVEVVLGGGAVAASARWRWAFAAALAPREVHYVRNPEVGAIGAALVATGSHAYLGSVEPVGRAEPVGRI